MMAISGIILVYQGLPVTSAALQAQRADAVVMKLRRVENVTTPEVSAGIDVLNKAVGIDPVAGRYFARSELEGGAGLTQSLEASPEARTRWLKRAKEDLEIALAHAPGRTIEWLRLAATREGIDGPSREIIAPLEMSIETGRWMEPAFYVRLRLIVDNWAYFTDAEKDGLQKYVSGMWRYANDRRFFGTSIVNPVDEVIIRNLLRDQPGAQEMLTKWILAK